MKAVSLVCLLALAGFALAFTPHYAGHDGEQGNLRYSIEYLNPPLLVDFPIEGYYQIPAYFIGTTMNFKIVLTNTGKRNFENLRVVAVQEYFDGGIVEGQEWSEQTVQSILSNGGQTFFIRQLRSGESVELQGSFFIPLSALPGLDRTRLLVLHWDNEDKASGVPKGGTGRVIVNDALAGVYCPPA